MANWSSFDEWLYILHNQTPWLGSSIQYTVKYLSIYVG